MSRTPPLSSAFNDTHSRGQKLSPQSGMCSFCTADCIGTCEIGLSAVLGAQSVYPTNTGNNQIASEKDYPLDYSLFNINGRVFGAQGAAPDGNQATIFRVNLERTFGILHPVKLALPVILPAVVKMNWRDYYAGAAMAGVCCVIGEGAPGKDPALQLTDGKITSFPLLGEMLDSFRRYDRGYGQIVLQCNCEDDAMGLPEYAIQEFGAKAIEFKFGQAAKGTQPVNFVKDLETALAKQAGGALVHPDPSDPAVQKAYEKQICPNFYTYGRLPMWDETNLVPRVRQLREMGLENVYFKMAGYDPRDLEHVLRIAAQAQVDMVTFDGAGGGSGYSPCKMMNEWCQPTVCMETILLKICQKLHDEGLMLPAITITGGFATEDQVYKALALGDGRVTAIGMCRASMAAANSGAKIGELIASGQLPPALGARGSTVQEVFQDLPDLRALYGVQANEFSPGAIGVFSFLNRIAFGLRHFCALNRKFDISLAGKEDLIPLTQDARALLNGSCP